MSKFLATFALVLVLPLAAAAQSLTAPPRNASVNGRYFFRQIQFSTDASGNITATTSSLGSLFFDGAGRFTVDGSQTVGILAATPLTGTGSYSVQTSGAMTISNPQRNGFGINARLGSELIVGSTTESGDNTFDLFAAIPAPAAGQGVALFQGTYSVSSFELQSGLATGVRSALFSLPVALGGAIGLFRASGHAANLQNGVPVTETVGGASFAMGADGIGTISLGSTSPLLSGTRNIYVSDTGNVVLIGSPYPGGHDFMVGVRQFSGRPAVKDISGLYATAGLRLDLKHLSTQAYVGTFNGVPTLGLATEAKRLHQFGTVPEEVVLANPLSANTDGTFTYGFNGLALGIGGNSFVAADLSALDPGGYSVAIGVRIPTLTGTGVSIDPNGLVNAATLVPGTAAVSPGEFVSLFGSGLAAAATGATPPYPFALGDVTVLVNGLPAPIAYVSATQVNFLVPYALTGSAATVVVNNGAVASNSVSMPLRKTTAGVFSADGSGTGPGAITHSNGSPVTAANPAIRGETIVVYASGLGALTTPVTDGVPSSGATASPIAVAIGGQAVKVTFAGLSPSFPGLYQVNVTIPANLVGKGALPLAIQAIDSFSDQVSIQIQ